MNALLDAYPNASYNNGIINLQPIPDIYMMFNENIFNKDYHAWNKKGESLTHKLEYSIKEIEMNHSNNDNKLIIVVKKFIELLENPNEYNIINSPNDLLDESKINFPNYNGLIDPLWNNLKLKYNAQINRQIHIYTYGTNFFFDNLENCSHFFDSAILRGSIAKNQKNKNSVIYKSLLKLNGLSLKVQEEVRGADMFEKFIEKIVSIVEKYDLRVIAITCRAGHHRSVSCAEMLKFLYVNRTVKHLTINSEL